MKRIAVTDRTTVRLIALCAALAFLLGINSLWRPQPHLPELAARADGATATYVNAPGEDTDGQAPDEAAAAALETQARPQRTVKPLPAYGVTVQRPLFHASRRPAPVKPKTAKSKKPPKPKAPPRSNLNGIRLTGVIMTAEKAFGLLSIPGQSELKRAPVGTVVKGWKVIDVEEAALVLNNGETDFRMALWKERPGQVSATVRRTQAPGQRPRNMAGGRR